jgi:hypothetical protein
MQTRVNFLIRQFYAIIDTSNLSWRLAAEAVTQHGRAVEPRLKSPFGMLHANLIHII